jgi:hypothetical protein
MSIISPKSTERSSSVFMGKSFLSSKNKRTQKNGGRITKGTRRLLTGANLRLRSNRITNIGLSVMKCV